MHIVLGPLLRTLYPPLCLLCGAAGADGLDLCRACRGALPERGPACPRCAAALPQPAPACGPCLRRPPPFDRVVAPLRYAFPIDRLIAGLKYGGRLAHARLLGGLLAAAAAGEPRPDLLVPVPLHRARLATRGFNQSAELARQVARALDLPWAPDAVRRLRDTPPQTGLARRARRRNLRGAFAARVAQPSRVAIVDDVMTTGSTVAELARTLRRAGARDVAVWCVARADGGAELG